MDYQVKICQKAEKTYYMEEIPPPNTQRKYYNIKK